ncbi:MAG: acyltransferase [Bacteroidota bacterium]
MKYINKIRSLIYFFLNVFAYKKLHIKSDIKFSNRVEGKKYITILKHAFINRGGWLLALKIDDTEPNLTINEGCVVGDYCHITSVRSVIIERDVMIASNVYISDNLHSFTDIDRPIKNQPVIFKSEVVIGSGTWIGENACIIGAKVGRNCVIGANATVNKDVPDYCVVAGNPGRIIMRYNFQTNIFE